MQRETLYFSADGSCSLRNYMDVLAALPHARVSSCGDTISAEQFHPCTNICSSSRQLNSSHTDANVLVQKPTFSGIIHLLHAVCTELA